MVLLLSLSFGRGGMEYEILRRKTKQNQKTTQKNKTKIKKQKKKTTAKAYYPQEL